MPDAFDEQLRRALAAAADNVQPPPGPDQQAADLLLARIRQRRRHQHLAGVGAGAGVLVVASALVALGVIGGVGPAGSSAQRVHTLGPAGGVAVATSVSPTAGPTETTVANGDPVPTTASCGVARCGNRLPATTGPGTTTFHAGITAPTAPSRTTTTRPTTTTTGSTGEMVVVTEAASGTTITLHVGQSLRVQLSGSAFDPWSQPMASDPNILQAQPTGMMPTQGSAIAQYRGAAAGQATVTATQDPACRSATPPCAILTRLFSLTVNVVG